MYYIGIDLGGTNIAVGIVNEACEMIKKGSVPTGRLRSFSEITKDMGALCKQLMHEAGILDAEIVAIGIACPGSIGLDGKSVGYANNIPSLNGEPLCDVMNQYFPAAKVYIANDADAAAYGEMICGAAKGEKDVIMITLGTGVGGGIIIDGKIYAGFNNAGGELGHMVIVADGAPCTCGRCGCWEGYASATALIQQTAETIKQFPESVIHEMIQGDIANITGKTAFDALQQGDAAGGAIVEQYVEYVGIGAANLINIFQPKKLVVGGGVSKAGEPLLAPLRQYVRKNTYGVEIDGIPRTEIVEAVLGNDAGIVGAAMLFQQYE